jgi:hypothetical protein
MGIFLYLKIYYTSNSIVIFDGISLNFMRISQRSDLPWDIMLSRSRVDTMRWNNMAFVSCL